MSSYLSVRPLTIILASLIGFGLSSCAVYDGQARAGFVYTMPPTGVAYYDYWYYPNAQVYYDTGRHVYFYLSSGGSWLEVRVLPPALRARLGVHVSVRSRYARPYRDYNEHRRKYPPRYRETPYPPARHGGSGSPYPHNYAPPVKQAPNQYEQRRERDNRQREENRQAPRFQLAPPLKKAPAQDSPRSPRRDNSGKTTQDRKRKDDKDNRSDRRRDRNQQDDQDRYRRYDRQ